MPLRNAEGVIADALLARVRADQVATLYSQWWRTSVSMGFGAALLCVVLWNETPLVAMPAWITAIVANQAWRAWLVARYRKANPSIGQAPRWGARWSIGSGIAGALWGTASVVMFPQSHAHQALLIVCVFGVALGGLNLTAVYKPTFYAFVLTALVPLVARVAWEADQVHLFTALVMLVVLVFVATYGHHLNDLLTQSVAMRYENTDLIDELTDQTAAAEHARAAAEAANRAKSQFLAGASHDLRQPLHAMGLFAAALAARAREPAIQPLIASIHASVEALESLFAQLLDLSRLEAGALRPEIGRVALQPLFDRIARDFVPQANAAGIVLRVRATSAVVITDAVLLERILRNFVANAVRHTREGGVLMAARRRGSAMRIDVVDTGAGIAACDRQRIFDEFVRAPGTSDPARSAQSLGLGLAIVRRLAALLEHDIRVTSAPGLGSCFSISLPRGIARRARVRTEATAEAPSRQPAPDAASRFASRVVMVIDDDPAVVNAMEALFSTWGARVVSADTAARGVAKLTHTCLPQPAHADLIVADLRLAEDASGIDAVRTIRDALDRETPALIISGDTTDAARAEAALAGIALLHKPLMAPALLAAAERALGACAPIDDARFEQDAVEFPVAA